MNTLYREKAFLGHGFTCHCCLGPVVTQDTMANIMQWKQLVHLIGDQEAK